jgi:CheY-like chemotaxis protein
MATLNALLIEDNPDDVLLTREALERSSLVNRLEVIGDGESAIERLLSLDEYSRPDVILLDLYLPKRTGIEVMDAIKQNRALDAVPVVILTSSTADEDFIRMFNLRANACLSKPIDVRALARAAQLDTCAN